MSIVARFEVRFTAYLDAEGKALVPLPAFAADPAELVPDYRAWLAGAVLQGAGTAMVYPTLLAAIAYHAHPQWRASSLGVYRFWRDLGYAIGALLSGVIADAVDLAAAIHVVAALTLASGIVVTMTMRRPRA